MRALLTILAALLGVTLAQGAIQQQHAALLARRNATPISVLFVVANDAGLHATYETPIYDWMVAEGYTVTIIDDGTAAPSPITQNVVIVGPEAAAATTKYSTATKGVLVMRQTVVNDMRLATEEAIASTFTSIYNLSTGHYIMQDFSAASTISYAAGVLRVRIDTVGAYPAGVIMLAQDSSGTADLCVGKAATGAVLTTGNAEGRRVIWGVWGLTTAGDNAKSILRRSIQWCSGMGAD